MMGGRGSGPISLDEPPPQPELRRAPRVRDLLPPASGPNTSFGSTFPDQPQSPSLGDAATDPMVASVKLVAEIESKLKILSSMNVTLLPIATDIITTLRTIVPQMLMAQQAGLPMGAAPGVPLESTMAGGAGPGQGGMPPGMPPGAPPPAAGPGGGTGAPPVI